MNPKGQKMNISAAAINMKQSQFESYNKYVKRKMFLIFSQGKLKKIKRKNLLVIQIRFKLPIKSFKTNTYKSQFQNYQLSEKNINDKRADTKKNLKKNCLNQNN